MALAEVKDMPQEKQQIIIVTGMSGAGKSQALNSLEDMGYEAVDNVPLNLLSAVASGASEKAPQRLAVGVDVRSRNFAPDAFLEELAALKKTGEGDITLMFMECDDDVIQRRFTETRRKHPLALDRPIADGIVVERELLAELRDAADAIVNTSRYTIHDLKRYLQDRYMANSSELLLFLTSFSFREGVPRDADMVMDVRFLKNPHYDEQLRALTGKDRRVGAYIEEDESFEPFFANLCNLIEPLLPRYRAEGKSYFTFAVGCTGGKHRSVYLAEKLRKHLAEKGYKLGIRHRDLK